MRQVHLDSIPFQNTTTVRKKNVVWWSLCEFMNIKAWRMNTASSKSLHWEPPSHQAMTVLACQRLLQLRHSAVKPLIAVVAMGAGCQVAEGRMCVCIYIYRYIYMSECVCVVFGGGCCWHQSQRDGLPSAHLLTALMASTIRVHFIIMTRLFSTTWRHNIHMHINIQNRRSSEGNLVESLREQMGFVKSFEDGKCVRARL